MQARAALLVILAVARPLAAQQGSVEPLDRPVTLAVRRATLVEALLHLRQAGAPLAWRGDQLPVDVRITLDRRDVSLRAVLAEMLRGTGLVWRSTSGGTVVLVPGAGGATDPGATTLATGIQALDQLVVTGSPVMPLPVREQPTAVTVVSERDLAQSPHRRLADEMRAYLPGLVLWDRGGVGPPPTAGAVRGVASFTARAPKLYVDGIEVASPELFTQLDGRGIASIEMIHGPQGAALYGPEALNGVIQIETRKGEPGQGSLSPRGHLLAGALDREFDGTSLWREGGAGIEADAPGAGILVLGSATRIGTASGPAEGWRVQGGGQLRLGSLRVEGSARAARREAPIERTLPLADAQAVRGLQPLEERGVGVRLRQVIGRRLSQAFTAGVHRISGSREPFRSPILPPRLPLGATNERAIRTSARWSGMITVDPVTLSVGTEASHRRLDRSARLADGSADLSALYQEALDSRGAFAQVRLHHGPLTVSGGARADRISSVGSAAATPWAATAGIAWTAPIGLTTLHLRAAWGRALRPPEPGMSQSLASGSIRQEANPLLRAERQSGIEFGVDLHFASGSWMRLTWYDQRASDLLQQVDLRRPTAMTRFYQFQNVGAITNRGVEFDGGAAVGRLSAAVRVQAVSSRVAALSPTYSGEFEVGDRPLEVPGASGSFALRYAAGGHRVEAGATWLGPWTGYDWRLVYRVESGQAPVRDQARDYWLRYAGVLRPFVGVTLPLRGGLIAWLRGEWPAGRAVLLRDNLSPPLGRSLLLGLELDR